MRNLALLSMFAVAALSNAAVHQLDITGLSFGGNTGVVNLSNVSGLQNGGYYAGPFDASLDGGPSMRVFCADLLDHTIFNSPTDVEPTDTATMGSGYKKAARLFNKYSASVLSDSTQNAALQVAIWKSIFTTVNYSDWTPGVTALANTYLASTDLASYSDHATYYDMHGANQAMIGAAPVPEPASIAALGVGAMGLLRRRKGMR